jgi:hypothetical protein
LGLKLVVVCPAGAVTGGPEAMHQLVHVANRIERGSAAILYWPFNQPHATPEPYVKYVVPKIQREQVPSDALVVLPEIWPDMAHTFKNRCALWWLSVDNFGTHGQRDMRRISLHLCQSEYAWRHTSGMGHRMMLTDWVELDVVDVPRQRRIVINPVKDAGLLRPWLDSTDRHVVQLRGLDRAGVARTLYGSEVYIDFGHHPGRDRPPREAALAGCIVFSTDHGAAAFWADMPIADWYKFRTVDELEHKLDCLPGVASDQDLYRAWVAGNRTEFEHEVGNLLRWLE